MKKILMLVVFMLLISMTYGKNICCQRTAVDALGNIQFIFVDEIGNPYNMAVVQGTPLYGAMYNINKDKEVKLTKKQMKVLLKVLNNFLKNKQRCMEVSL